MVNTDEKEILEDNFVRFIKPYRSSEVEHITSVLDKVDIFSLRRTMNYYPIRFLTDGVAAFKYGFNEASIFYSGTAVEIGLLCLMKDIVNQTIQKKTKPNITFDWLIRNAGNLLDVTRCKICHDIRLMRNCYIHYENIVAHLAFLEQVQLPKIREQVKAEFGLTSDIMKKINEMDKQFDKKRNLDGMLGIRFKHLEKSEILSFIDKRYLAYLKWLSAKGNITTKEREVIFTHEAFDAQECLTWAFEIIKTLGFIK